MKFFLLSIVITALHKGCLGEQSYVVTNEQIDHFAGSEQTLADFSKLKTIKRERFINGSVTFLEDMNKNDFVLEAKFFSSPNGDGDWRPMAMGVPKTQICEAFKTFYREFAQPSFEGNENTNMPIVPEEGLCPIPGGEYYLKNILFNTESWPTQVPRGIIKAVVTFYKKDVSIGGVIIVVKIEDKSS